MLEVVDRVPQRVVVGADRREAHVALRNLANVARQIGLVEEARESAQKIPRRASQVLMDHDLDVVASECVGVPSDRAPEVEPVLTPVLGHHCPVHELPQRVQGPVLAIVHHVGLVVVRLGQLVLAADGDQNPHPTVREQRLDVVRGPLHRYVRMPHVHDALVGQQQSPCAKGGKPLPVTVEVAMECLPVQGEVTDCRAQVLDGVCPGQS